MSEFTVTYGGTLLGAKNLKESVRFYTELLGLEVLFDLGTNITLSGGLALQEADSWAGFLLEIPREEVKFGGKQFEVVYETDNIEAFCEKAKAYGADFVHPVREYPWGQNVVRLYDPSGNIVEIGEQMDTVLKRFFEKGMTAEEIVAQTGYPLEYLVEFEAKLKREG